MDTDGTGKKTRISRIYTNFSDAGGKKKDKVCDKVRDKVSVRKSPVLPGQLRGVVGVVAQVFDRGAVGLYEAGAELPALIELGDFEEQRIPAGLQSDIYLVCAGMKAAEGVVRVD